MATPPRRPSLLTVLTVLTVALACSNATAPSGTVTAVSTLAGIRATNETNRPVFYTAVEREASALYDFFPCTDASRCDNIAPGASATLPWSRVASFDPAKHEYLFYWWQAPPPDDTQARSGTLSVLRQ